MLRTPHCLDNRLTDGGKVVSPTHRPLLYSPETLSVINYIYDLTDASARHVSRFVDRILSCYNKEKSIKAKLHVDRKGILKIQICAVQQDSAIY
jgi:hypothetical protein